jgi:hypothetical protein
VSRCGSLHFLFGKARLVPEGSALYLAAKKMFVV